MHVNVKSLGIQGFFCIRNSVKRYFAENHAIVALLGRGLPMSRMSYRLESEMISEGLSYRLSEANGVYLKKLTTFSAVKIYKEIHSTTQLRCFARYDRWDGMTKKACHSDQGCEATAWSESHVVKRYARLRLRLRSV